MGGSAGSSTTSIQIGFENALRPATSSTSIEYQVRPVAVSGNSTLVSRGPSAKVLVATTFPAPINIACFKPGTDPTKEGFDPLLAVLEYYEMNVGRDNFDFEGSEDQKNFAAWRGESIEGAEK